MIQAAVLGLIQGITEFLPISSSGHLLVFPFVFNLPDQGLAVDAALHLATALAIFFYFRQDWWQIIKGWKGKNSMLRKIVIASIPAAIFGLLLNDIIENVLRSPWVVVVMLIAVAGLMWWIEGNYSQVSVVSTAKKTQDNGLNVSWGQALLIGLVQVIALIPGTSRSGVTIIAGMWQTLSREKAARFSFLLGAPITFGAGLVKLPELINTSQDERQFVIVAAIVAFGVALVTIKWLLAFLTSGTLKPFAIYRVLLAVAISAFLLLGI